jgi:hypothetical protein
MDWSFDVQTRHQIASSTRRHLLYRPKRRNSAAIHYHAHNHSIAIVLKPGRILVFFCNRKNPFVSPTRAAETGKVTFIVNFC